FRSIGKWGTIVAIIITFVLVGLWHGANWTFAVFGLYHGLLYIPLMLSGSFFKKSKLKTNRYGLPTLRDASKMFLTFLLVTFGLIIFKAENITQAWDYLCRMLSHSLFTFPDSGRMALIYSLVLVAIEWVQRDKQHALQMDNVKYRAVRWGIYSFIALYTITNAGGQAEFIYVQF
ncbi:hypothetical protein EZS27_020850, partial [termite gut metagenome]